MIELAQMVVLSRWRAPRDLHLFYYFHFGLVEHMDQGAESSLQTTYSIYIQFLVHIFCTCVAAAKCQHNKMRGER
jgi:hypothetical protein